VIRRPRAGFFIYTSGIQIQHLAGQRRTFKTQHRTSNIKHLTSNISSPLIKHPFPVIKGIIFRTRVYFLLLRDTPLAIIHLKKKFYEIDQ